MLLDALWARDFEALARPVLLRGVLRIVSGYPVAVFSGKMNRFTTNNFPWASTRFPTLAAPYGQLARWTIALKVELRDVE